MTAGNTNSECRWPVRGAGPRGFDVTRTYRTSRVPGEGDLGGSRRSYSDADPKRTLNPLLPAETRKGQEEGHRHRIGNTVVRRLPVGGVPLKIIPCRGIYGGLGGLDIDLFNILHAR